MAVKMFFNIEMLLTAVGYGCSNFYNIDYRTVFWCASNERPDEGHSTNEGNKEKKKEEVKNPDPWRGVILWPLALWSETWDTTAYVNIETSISFFSESIETRAKSFCTSSIRVSRRWGEILFRTWPASNVTRLSIFAFHLFSSVKDNRFKKQLINKL